MDYPPPQQPPPDLHGEGEGDTLGPDVSIEQERREIERAAYQRRAASDSSDGDGERDDENL